MTPEEQQPKQAELAALRAMNDERIAARRDALATQAALNEVGYLLSDKDKAYFQQDIVQQQQRIESIVKDWQKAPYSVSPGRDGIYHAIRAREDALGLPHQERQEPQPHPTLSPLPQDAEQPLSAQEMIKHMTHYRDAYGHAQDILDIGKTVRLSDLAQKYLADQQRVAQEGFESNRRAYEAKYGQLPPGSIPKYVHLQEQHTSAELEQMARDINYKALQDLYTKAAEQKALHPDIQKARQQERSGPER